MGAVVTGTYQMSITGWAMYPLRTPILDWCPSNYYTSTLLVMKFQPNNFDFSLYLRPFSWQSWIAIISFSCSIMIMISYCNFQLNAQFDSCFIVKTSGWYFFLLLSSFYSGALTSYFANKSSIPFSTMTDVIEAYPGELIDTR